MLHLRVGSPVQLRTGDNIVSRLRQRNNGGKNGVGTTGHGQSSHFVRSFELGVPGLEDVIGRIAQTGINISEFGKGKEIGGVFGALEDVGSGSVDGYPPGCPVTDSVDRVGIGFVSTVQCDGVKSSGRGGGLGEGSNRRSQGRPCGG